MNLRNLIELQAKDTLGYKEAENKESFMVGVSVAISKIEGHYERQIETLKKQVEAYKSTGESLQSDLTTLANIINRYSDKD